MTEELLEKKEALFDYGNTIQKLFNFIQKKKVNELYQTSLDLEKFFDTEEHQKDIQHLLKTFIHELETDESNNEQYLEDMSTKLLLEIVPVIDELNEQKDVVRLVVKEEEKLKEESNKTNTHSTRTETETDDYSTDYIPMSQRTIKYDFSDWVNFVFEMKGKKKNH